MSFPNDTVFVKTFWFPNGDAPAVRQPVETQLLHFDGRDFRQYLVCLE